MKLSGAIDRSLRQGLMSTAVAPFAACVSLRKLPTAVSTWGLSKTFSASDPIPWIHGGDRA